MAHWRSLVGQRDWFDVADLGGKERLVQIESCSQGRLETFVGGRKETKAVIAARLVGYERPLAMKATLCRSMVSLYGTGLVEQWAGKWITLWPQMITDPQGGPGAKCEAVRIKPNRPTDDEIRAALAARGGKPGPAPKSDRDEAADAALVESVCAAMDAAGTPDEVDAAIAPHRDELKQMVARLRSIVASAKKARLATLAQVAAPNVPAMSSPDADHGDNAETQEGAGS